VSGGDFLVDQAHLITDADRDRFRESLRSGALAEAMRDAGAVVRVVHVSERDPHRCSRCGHSAHAGVCGAIFNAKSCECGR
jgi:hypothetical protein